LIPDLSAAAEVLLARDEGKVLVPIEAIQAEADRTFVYLRRGPQFEKRYVQIGLRGNTDAVVTSGLSSGDRVALARPPAGS
jgi:multidrug efflux pump subunit AcrA (membrane-fusion protein)